MRKKIKEFMIKDLHYMVLAFIVKNPGIYPSEMGKWCTYSHLHRITKEMTKLGLIYSVRKGCKKLLYPTKKGTELLELLEKVDVMVK